MVAGPRSWPSVNGPVNKTLTRALIYGLIIWSELRLSRSLVSVSDRVGRWRCSVAACGTPRTGAIVS